MAGTTSVDNGRFIYELNEATGIGLDSVIPISIDNLTKRITFKTLIKNLRGDGKDPENSFYTRQDADNVFSSMQNTINSKLNQYSVTIDDISNNFDSFSLLITDMKDEVDSKISSFETTVNNMESKVIYLTKEINTINQDVGDHNHDERYYTRNELTSKFDNISEELANRYTKEQIDDLLKNLYSGSSGSAESAGSLSVVAVTSGTINLDNYKDSKIYFLSNTATLENAPADCVNGWLWCIPFSGATDTKGNTIKQFFFRFGTKNNNDFQVYTRTCFSDGWSNWTRMFTSADITYGTEVPSTLSAGNIYLQYF